jgi:hypothetical protein
MVGVPVVVRVRQFEKPWSSVLYYCSSLQQNGGEPVMLYPHHCSPGTDRFDINTVFTVVYRTSLKACVITMAFTLSRLQQHTSHLKNRCHPPTHVTAWNIVMLCVQIVLQSVLLNGSLALLLILLATVGRC